MSYTIWIFTPPSEINTRCFNEVALGLQAAFKALGQDVPIVTDHQDLQGTPIVLGANMLALHHQEALLPPESILFNLEQVHPHSWWFAPERGYVELLKKHRVWDASYQNIRLLKDFGIHHVLYCGIGYMPELRRISAAAKEDIDVLFVGRPHPRRKEILDALQREGVNVHHVINQFGEERDALIARSKILLNIHMEPARLFEMVRVSYWLANEKCVVSETGSDTQIENALNKAVVFAPYEALVATCLAYSKDKKKRQRQAKRGFKIFSGLSQVPMLEHALQQTPPYDNTRPAIFVNIASYRDSECHWTVKDLFEKATHPERIHVGICWQYDPQEDMDCFAVDYPRAEQVRVVQYHVRDSRGAGWARNEAQALWQGEEYTLQIHAHMRFEPGWDETLIEMLARCPTEKAVLTAWLPGYKPPDKKLSSDDKLFLLLVGRLEKNNNAQIVYLNRHEVKADTVRGHLHLSCSWVGNFMFTRSSALEDVPFDPYIYFWGEELNYSARLWTHGYDMYQLDRLVLYHYWDRAGAKDDKVYRNHQIARNQLSLTRNLHLLGIKASRDNDAIIGLDHYPLGTVRRLEDYWRFAGIDLRNYSLAPHAREGKWKWPRENVGRDPGSRGLSSLVRDVGNASIFICIASYRDPECSWTVKDLFEKAAHPGRIHVGICLQVDPQDKECLVDTNRPQQVRIAQVHSRDSQGANWARAEALKLWNGEDYVLQIDSHMRFEPGWDDALIDMLHRCPEKSVLSTYVPRYTPSDNKEHYPGQILRAALHSFGEPGHPQLLHQGRTYVPLADRERSGLYPAPFIIANFLFCRAEVFQQLPVDPHIQFWGDEITFSARLWTHGYTVYQPDRVVAYHYWRRDELASEQPYRRLGTPRSKRVLARINHMLGLELTRDAAALEAIERYGVMGTARALEDLWKFAGIDWQRRKIAKDSLQGKWNLLPLKGGIKKKAIEKVQMTPPPSRPFLPKRKETIFINIASYRDRECQWTVKDLFEKAADPNRIRVGICWQFDPKEDADCFQISTRPEQVRMLPVDWREAEGVCWARHQTQQLWDGEDYTLMTDSHMRFEPGWDELMIRELEACESDKPLLSCSPASYEPPYRLGSNLQPTIRRVKPFTPDGNIRCQGETLSRSPEKPLRGAFMVANFAFSRANVIEEVPYDPYLYFDQEEISYAARLYTHGWDIFSARKQFLYHYYNDRKPANGWIRPLHWNDLHKENQARIHFLRDRGLKRFNHLTGYQLSQDAGIVRELEKYGFGKARSFQEFQEYSGVDFKRKIATERALRCLFIRDLPKYRDQPIFVPELDKQKIPAATPPKNSITVAPSVQPVLKTAFKTLDEGDFIPMFEVMDTDQNKRAMELYGGQHCMLFFLPAGDVPYLTRFFSHLQQQFERAPHKHIWQLFILDDTVENLVALKAKLGVPHVLWADPDRRLARAFGLYQPGHNTVPPTGYLLNSNLQIVRRRMDLPPDGLAAAMVDDSQAELTNYRHKYQQSLVITEMAPALIIPNAFTPELCKKCIDAFHTGHTFDGTVGAEQNRAYRPRAKVRTDHIIGGALLDEIDEKLSRSVFPEIKKVFGFEVTHRELYKVGLYRGEKGGFFKQHRDNFEAPLAYRRIAMTLHLNDNYEGGGLRFPEYGQNIYRPKAGGGIAFSCSTMHEAMPVTSGDRYILVCFLHGEEEEAYRRHYLAGKGQPLKIRDYAPKVNLQIEVAQSRDFFKEWRRKNVKFVRDDA